MSLTPAQISAIVALAASNEALVGSLVPDDASLLAAPTDLVATVVM